MEHDVAVVPSRTSRQNSQLDALMSRLKARHQTRGNEKLKSNLAQRTHETGPLLGLEESQGCPRCGITESDWMISLGYGKPGSKRGAWGSWSDTP